MIRTPARLCALLLASLAACAADDADTATYGDMATPYEGASGAPLNAATYGETVTYGQDAAVATTYEGAGAAPLNMDSYSYGYYDMASMCGWGCRDDFLDDGECDEVCNVEACGWDGSDCFVGYGECYENADGDDYRGVANTTTAGTACQFWTHVSPQQHSKQHFNFPTSGLGGHNHCRNPDGEAGPWCFTMDPDVRWELCDVEPPSAKCGHPKPVAAEPASVRTIELNQMIDAEVAEHQYAFFEVSIPPSIEFIKVRHFSLAEAPSNNFTHPLVRLFRRFDPAVRRIYRDASFLTQPPLARAPSTQPYHTHQCTCFNVLIPSSAEFTKMRRFSQPLLRTGRLRTNRSTPTSAPLSTFRSHHPQS